MDWRQFSVVGIMDALDEGVQVNFGHCHDLRPAWQFLRAKPVEHQQSSGAFSSGLHITIGLVVGEDVFGEEDGDAGQWVAN
jgi:hypothetical protein